MRRLRLLVIPALLLTACSGSGKGSESPSITPTILATELGSPSESATPSGPAQWDGTIHSESTDVFRQGATFYTCTEIWDLTLTFTVDDAGAIDGSGSGSLASLRNCHATYEYDFTNNAQHVTFNVGGTAFSDHIELQVQETSIDGHNNGLLNYTLLLYPQAKALEVPVTGPGTAGGEITVHYTDPTGSKATAVHTVRLECTSC